MTENQSSNNGSASAEDVIETQEEVVQPHGMATYFFVWLLGGIPHLFKQCSVSTLKQRGSIGAMFFLATLLDWCITSAALFPIVEWWSLAVASTITLFVISIDRGIFISVDGGRKPKTWILAARGSLAVLQILFMGLALLVAISNNMVDRTIAEAQFRERQAFDAQIEQIRAEFNAWKAGERKSIDDLSQKIIEERQHCQDEAASGDATTGRDGRMVTGKRGVGPVAKACFANVEKMEARLDQFEQSYKETHGEEESARVVRDDARISAIEAQKKQVATLQQTGKQQTGMLDRLIVLVVEGRKIIHSNMGAVWIVLGLETLFAVLLGNVFISKLTLEFDEYDLIFCKDKRLDEIEEQRRAAETEREHREQEAELMRMETVQGLAKRKEALEEGEINRLESEVKRLERLAEAQKRLADVQAKYPAGKSGGKKKKR